MPGNDDLLRRCARGEITVEELLARLNAARRPGRPELSPTPGMLASLQTLVDAHREIEAKGVTASLNCSAEQLIAATELIQVFLFGIDMQPAAREFNMAVLLRAVALLRGEVEPARIRPDQIAEALATGPVIDEKIRAALSEKFEAAVRKRTVH